MSLDRETVEALDRLKERTGQNRSQMIRNLLVFFNKQPEQLDKILEWVEGYKKWLKGQRNSSGVSTSGKSNDS